ncbi:MAG: ribonuclease E/G, partial [Bacteroidales bacterium]|nr:ribonuclease E/G [Bacteroidales bacterium]
MSKELYIDSRDGNVQIALLENKVLVELHKEKQSNSFRVGDIYVGKVKKLIPGLNAAFVDIGCEKDAFLHYQDLGSRFTTFHAYTKQCLQGNVKSPSLSDVKLIDEIDKHGEIKDVLSAGDLILTQISKEAISTKGPRLVGEISLVGRFCIMLPFSDEVMVSQKIKSKAERNRLRDIMLKIKPPHMGIIIRTVAKDQNIETLHTDMRL